MLSSRGKRAHSSSENIIVLKKHKPNPNMEIAYLSPDCTRKEKNLNVLNDSELITAESGQKIKIEEQEEIYLEEKNVQEQQKEFDCVFEILQPFKNIALFPNELQRKIAKGTKLNQKQFFQTIFSLKTPQNHFSFLKKIEKLKLLALGQETMIKSYLRERSKIGTNRIFLKDYLNLMNSKITLSKTISDIAQNMNGSDESNNQYRTVNNFNNGVKVEGEEYLNYVLETHNDDFLNFMEISKYSIFIIFLYINYLIVFSKQIS